MCELTKDHSVSTSAVLTELDAACVVYNFTSTCGWLECFSSFSLAGCPEAALKNIYNATRSANCQGALGLVACNWTGRGHMVHLPFCWPGFLVAAGLGWNSDCHWVGAAFGFCL